MEMEEQERESCWSYIEIDRYIDQSINRQIDREKEEENQLK